MSNFPMVSVVMPVYNCEKYLREAIESILTQTYRDFELIMIDDGSTDGSAALLDEYRQSDERVMVYTHQKNQGIVAALNSGLDLARGKYIARMDADDISLPERFEKQVEFLENHNKIGILGGAMILMDAQSQRLGYLEIGSNAKILNDLYLRWISLLSNIFMHPTVMIRSEILKQFDLSYSTKFEHAEDYDLWVRLLKHTAGANLDEPLVRYRIHLKSISVQRQQEQIAKHTQISYTHIQCELPEIDLLPEEHSALIAAFSGDHRPSIMRQRPMLARRYLELWQAFSMHHYGDPELKCILRDVVVSASKIGLYPPFQPGWLGTMRCLFNTDPAWLFHSLVNFPIMVRNKLLGIRISRLRRRSQ